jgi:hypothetical protein
MHSQGHSKVQVRATSQMLISLCALFITVTHCAENKVDISSSSKQQLPLLATYSNESVASVAEVLPAVNMKNVVLLDIKTQFVLHRRHITSPLQRPAT